MQISRSSFIRGTLALAAGAALAACSGRTGASQTSAGTRTITDHAGHEVALPQRVTRVVFDQIPIESTYIAYFDGAAPHLVGMWEDRVTSLKETVAAAIAPDILKVDTSFYKDGELNTESLLALKPDAVLYNANNTEHGQAFRTAGIPAVGFSTKGDPTTMYGDWMTLLEQVFDEPGKMKSKIALGGGYVEDAAARAAQVPQEERRSAMVLMGVSDGQLTVAAGTPGWFTDSWAKRLSYTDAAAGTTGSALPVTLEEVLTWNPDAILVTGKGMSGITAQDILATGSTGGVDFTQLSAYQNQAVYSSGLGMWNWFTPNPDAPLAAYWVGASLYPDRFADIDLPSLAKDYYKQMYSFEASDEQIATILDPDA